jgi:hypothetical protein
MDGQTRGLVRVHRFGMESLQQRLFFPVQVALTPCVPLSREAGEGEHAAGRTAVRPYTPLPRCGRGAGGEGKK